MKIFNWRILLLLLVPFLVPIGVLAINYEKGGTVSVPANQTIDDSFYAAGTNITVDGRVIGDVICAGQSITINGTVDGDVICAGQAININGTVGGNVRLAGNTIAIRGSVARVASLFGAYVSLPAGASIGWDIMIGAANAEVDASIGRSMVGMGSYFKIGSRIGQNADFFLDKSGRTNEPQLYLTDTAFIGGNLTYSSRTEASISQQATITGEVSRRVPPAEPRKGGNAYLIFSILSILSALLVGIVIAAVWPDATIAVTETMINRFWPSIGLGFAAIFLTPILVLILLFTVIGIRLALLVLGVWLIIISLAKLFAAISIGRLAVKSYRQGEQLILAAIVGILVMYTIFYIPYLGWILSFFAMLWGVGGLILPYRMENRTRKNTKIVKRSA